MATDRDGKVLKTGDTVFVLAVVSRIGVDKVTVRAADGAQAITVPSNSVMKTPPPKLGGPLGPGTTKVGPHE